MATSPKNSASDAKGSSLGEVLEPLSSLEPYSISVPLYITVMRTCGNGVVASLYDGKLLQVCVSPEPTCYHLESVGYNERIVRLEVSKNKEFCLSGGYKGAVKIWSLPQRKEVAKLAGHSEAVSALKITHDDLRGITAGEDLCIKIWDLPSKAELFVLKGFDFSVLCLALSANNRLLYAGGSSGKIQVWDLEERKETETLVCEDYLIMCLTLSPNDEYLWSGSSSGDVRVWNTRNSQEIVNFKEKNPIKKILLTQRGQIGIPLSSQRETNLHNLEGKGDAVKLIGHSSMVNDQVVFNNEKFCLTASEDETIRMWDLETGGEVVVFRGHDGKVTQVTLTEDNQYCISGGWDCTIKIWSLVTRKVSKEIRELGYLTEHLSVTQKYVIIPQCTKLKLCGLEENYETTELEGMRHSVI